MKKKVFTLFSLATFTCLLSSCFFFRSESSFSTSQNTARPEYTYTKTYKDWIGEGFSTSSTAGYRYLPSTGNAKILVIPIQFSDYTFTNYELNRIQKGFFGDSTNTGWESVASYYYKSSYGQLNIDGAVTDVISLNMSSTQFTTNYNSYSGDYTSVVLETALQTLYEEQSYDFSSYDLDGDGYLDAVWMVYSAPYSSSTSSSALWAFTTWDQNKTDIGGGYKACCYSWASVDFLVRNVSSTSALSSSDNADCHTFIHETGHMMGLDDYYSYDADGITNTDSPVGGIDMMDFNIGDHCAYSKYFLGWIQPTVIDADYIASNGNTVTLNALTDTSTTENKAYLIPCYKDGSMAYNGTAYDEYLLIEYSTPTGLNELDSSTRYVNGLYGYTKKGVLVYHVNASIGKLVANRSGTAVWDGNYYDEVPEYTGQSGWGTSYLYYYIYSNTRSYSYNTLTDASTYYRGRLISLMPEDETKTSTRTNGYSSNDSLYTLGDNFGISTYTDFAFDDNGSYEYGFTVTSIGNTSCTLTFQEV